MARINNGNLIVFDSSNYTPITLQYGIKSFVASTAIKINGCYINQPQSVNRYTIVPNCYGYPNTISVDGAPSSPIYVQINEVSPHINPNWATDIIKNWYAGDAAASTQSDSNKPKEVLADE